VLCAILGRTAGRTPVLLLVDRDEKHHPNTDMGKRRMTVSEREQRRKLRKLMKMVDFVPAHKKALATALVQLASRSEGAEERKTLERLDRLTDAANEGRQVAARPDLEQHLRDIDSGAVVDSGVGEALSDKSNSQRRTRGDSKYPSTPGGHPADIGMPHSKYIYTPTHQQFSDGRLPCKPNIWRTATKLAEQIFAQYREYKPAGLADRFEWDSLSGSERKTWIKAMKGIWQSLDDVWPKELPVRPPVVPPGYLVCPACDGTTSVPRSLKVALEWFLARRAKKTKLDGRYRIEPHDWGYDEISAVELCSHYKEKRGALVEVILESGGPQLYQNQAPTRLHPMSVDIRRFPSALQMHRGALEVREKEKNLSASHRTELRRLKRERMIKGPLLVRGEDGRWSCDWRGLGVGCRVVHNSSGLSSECDRFSNFKQNMSKAELDLEKEVEKWFEAKPQEAISSLGSDTEKRNGAVLST